MTTDTSDIVEYPFVKHDDLTVDPRYSELQRRGPIRARLPYGEPCWIATRYDDVKTVYGDRRFGKALVVGRDMPRMWPTRVGDDPTLLANMDPPKHTRLRRLTSGAFAPGQIRNLRGWVEGLVDEHLDHLVAAGQPADFISLYSFTFPLHVITGILGVPEANAPTFKGWIDEMIAPDSSPEVREHAHETVTEFIKGLIAERRGEASDDLFSILVRARDDEDRLNEDELVSLCMSLFLGGFETTAAQLGSTVYTLMTHRHLWQELLEAPALLPAALEELWRWIPSFRYGQAVPLSRWAYEDVELSGGVVIPAGAPVVPEHQVANRDESVFPHGWELDFHRVDPQPHLSLAWGAHRCMGAHLAHLEVEATLTKLLQRFPTLELAVPAEDVKWSQSTFLRSAAELPLAW